MRCIDIKILMLIYFKTIQSITIVFY